MEGNKIMNNEKYKYKECFVAFLDILGFSVKVQKSETDAELLNSLIETLRINKKLSKNEKKVTGNGKIAIRSYFFSDSLVFVMRENKKDLAHLFLIIRYLQDKLWENNLCLRGGIALGKFYWSDYREKILIGPAMIEAYKLENEIAIYPRIVISNRLLEYIEKDEINAWPIGANDAKLRQFIKTDKDGIHFIDLLNPEIIRKQFENIYKNKSAFSITWDPSGKDNYKKVLENIDKTISIEIDNKNIKIRQKYEWLKSYMEEAKKNNTGYINE